MSQYDPRQYPNWYPQQQPNPLGYTPADPYGQGTPGSLKTCKTAAVCQFVMGALICLLAFCFLAAGAVVAAGAIPPEQQGELEQLAEELGGALGPIMLVAGICIGMPGLAQVILGFFVWRGSKAAIIISAIVDGIMGLLILVGMAGTLIEGGSGAMVSVCFNLVMFALAAGLFVMLIMAFRETSAVAAAKAAYEAQWQQYYQYQAMQQQMPGQVTPPPAPAEQPGAAPAAPTEPTPPPAGPPAPPAGEDRPEGNPPPG